MLPTVAVTAAFPVPTQANPGAFFTKQRLVEGTDEEASNQGGDDDVLRALRADLAVARNDNRAKVAEDFRRREDLEACKRKWKSADAARTKEERTKEHEAMGLPESCAYLLDTAQYAMRQHREDGEQKSITETNDADAKVYERAVKRILLSKDGDDSAQPGTNRLMRDLETRAGKNAKRSRAANEFEGGEGVNKANAQFNKNLERTTGKDARAQMIKQNLERGTAL